MLFTENQLIQTDIWIFDQTILYNIKKQLLKHYYAEQNVW